MINTFLYHKALLALIMASLLAGLSCNQSKETRSTKYFKNTDNDRLLVGTYTRKEGHVDGNAEGIYVYRFDTLNGKLTHEYTLKGLINPSYLEVHPNKKWIYAISETAVDDESSSKIYFIKYENTNTLSLVDEYPALGDFPCHISLNKAGNLIATANYGGSAGLFMLNNDGEIVESSLIKHKGNGPTDRQKSAHAHMTYFEDENVYVSDLGADKVFIHKIKKNELSLELVDSIKCSEGAGPRHLAYHAYHKIFYVLNELNGTIEAFKKNNNATFKKIQTISSVKQGNDKIPASADIHIHPNGRMLFTSNRGDYNNISVFTINSSSGKLKFENAYDSGGKAPRNFVIHKSGRYLLAANQDSRNVISFEINTENVSLIKIQELSVPTPVCLKFMD